MGRITVEGGGKRRSQSTGAARFVAAMAISTAMSATALTQSYAQEAYIPGAAEPGTEIPKSTVRLGLLPYADGSFPIIGVKKGFFTDVGITMSPADGTTLTEESAHSLLVRGDVDITHGYPPNFLPTYQTSRAVKQVMFHDIIVAGCVLAAPELGLKSVKDYMAEGKPFAEAIAAAMAPVQGKELASTPVANERLFEDTITQLSGVTWTPKILDDSNILVAAKAGQIQFAHPSGAPIVYSLIQDKWTRLVCLDDLIANGPTGPDSPILRSITAVGVEANGEWVNKNPNTVLRYISAVWRTIDEIKADPSLYDIQAPVLNSIAGTNLTGADLAQTVALFHPYIPYADNTRFYTDTSSIVHYKALYEQILAAFVENGVVPEGVTPDEFVWGGKLWLQLEDYRQKTDKLLAAVDEANLPENKKALLADARKYYGWHDYLDAYRFAVALSE